MAPGEAVVSLHDYGAERLRGHQPGARQHGELAVEAHDAARRDFDVLLAKRQLHVVGGQGVGGETRAVEPDEHGHAALAVAADFGDAGQRSEERSGGKECVMTGSFRSPQSDLKKTHKYKTKNY